MPAAVLLCVGARQRARRAAVPLPRLRAGEPARGPQQPAALLVLQLPLLLQLPAVAAGPRGAALHWQGRLQAARRLSAVRQAGRQWQCSSVKHNEMLLMSSTQFDNIAAAVRHGCSAHSVFAEWAMCMHHVPAGVRLHARFVRRTSLIRCVPDVSNVTGMRQQ